MNLNIYDLGWKKESSFYRTKFACVMTLKLNLSIDKLGQLIKIFYSTSSSRFFRSHSADVIGERISPNFFQMNLNYTQKVHIYLSLRLFLNKKKSSRPIEVKITSLFYN